MFFRKKNHDTYEKTHSNRKALNHIPSIFRRKPFYKRLPDWTQAYVEGLMRSFLTVIKAVAGIRRRMPGGVFAAACFLTGLAIGAVSVAAIMKQRRDAADIVVVVRGVPIKQQNLFHRMETQVGGATLQQMVTEELLLQYVREKHCEPSSSQIEARTKQIMAQPGFEAAMKDRNAGPGDVAQMARVALAKESLFGADVPVSEAEVRAYYGLQSDPRNPRAPYYAPETAECSVIVTDQESRIRKAETELHQGKTFADTAKIYSQDKSGTEGGNLPPLQRGRSFLSSSPEFEKAVFGLTPGELMPPHRIGTLWYLIAVRSRTPARVTPFADVQEQCRHEAGVIKAARTSLKQVAGDFAAFRRKSKLQVFWEQYYYPLLGNARQVTSSSP